ncbi:DNA pilot protein [Blackfly microvirus SF02]|uniref:DNA pilot protein n=1 Tax=Blackfly microvirus SF02 TaxID=2576452 RepID=A0A4P8PKN2_9VIRU|nr:DNA pilot protein [Blackfly microvirus SF02]
MPMSDETKGGLIGGAASIIGQGINAISTGSMNKKTREWNEKQYGIQRANALADWNAQNAYNAPEQQMARLKAAGLNPNLVYGNGATATSAQPVRSTSTADWKPQAPQVNATAVTDSYFDSRIKNQTVTNMQLQAKVLEQEALDKKMDISGKGITQARNQYDLDMAQRLQANTIAQAEGNLERIGLGNAKTIVDTKFTSDQNDRNQGRFNSDMESAVLSRLKMKADTTNSQLMSDQIKANTQNALKEGLIKDFEILLNKKGFTKSDPVWQRAGLTLVDAIVSGKGRAALDKLANIPAKIDSFKTSHGLGKGWAFPQ